MVDLLDPLEVKGLTLKNRIVMPPMQTGLATTDGNVTEKLVKHYVRRCGSLGLIIVEHSYISFEGKFSERQLGIYDDNLLSGLEELSSSIHDKDTPVVIQINHAGRTTNEEIMGMQPVAPSKVGTARKLTIKEIEALVEGYVEAAERAMKTGFDGVEVHGAHGFLINQFYSPLVNKRKDRYGGSFENRTRFALEIVERVKERVGGRLLLYRLGSVDLDPKGIQIEDSKKFALKLQEAGVDIIDVSGGLCGSRPVGLQGVQGYFIRQSQEIKQVVSIPIIGVGGIKDPEYASKFIEEEKVDLVAIGRSLYKDPDWAEKANKRTSD